MHTPPLILVPPLSANSLDGAHACAQEVLFTFVEAAGALSNVPPLPVRLLSPLRSEPCEEYAVRSIRRAEPTRSSSYVTRSLRSPRREARRAVGISLDLAARMYPTILSCRQQAGVHALCIPEFHMAPVRTYLRRGARRPLESMYVP